MRRSWQGWVLASACAAMIACSHSEGFEQTVLTSGPFTTGSDIRLTYNSDQDLWPIYSEDGSGILYSFVNVGSVPQHRCVGLLPAGGGARTWTFCDNRATQGDSVNSITAYALGADGRLIYSEAVSRAGAQSTAPSETTLWLADSAHPLQRKALLTLPTIVSGTSISWFADLSWTGPSTFIALAEDLSFLGHCLNCGPVDSIYYGQGVVRGTIAAGGGATLQLVAGTNGATGYSFAESGASIVFTMRNDVHLYKVPATGGTAVAVATVTPNSGAQLLGVSCKASTCVVAVDGVNLSAVTANGVTFASGPGFAELRQISLASGVSQVLRSSNPLIATPQISPISGDVVVQVGGGFGHLQSNNNPGSDLHLFQGLVP